MMFTKLENAIKWTPNPTPEARTDPLRAKKGFYLLYGKRGTEKAGDLMGIDSGHLTYRPEETPHEYVWASPKGAIHMSGAHGWIWTLRVGPRRLVLFRAGSVPWLGKMD